MIPLVVLSAAARVVVFRSQLRQEFRALDFLVHTITATVSLSQAFSLLQGKAFPRQIDGGQDVSLYSLVFR